MESWQVPPASDLPAEVLQVVEAELAAAHKRLAASFDRLAAQVFHCQSGGLSSRSFRASSPSLPEGCSSRGPPESVLKRTSVKGSKDHPAASREEVQSLMPKAERGSRVTFGDMPLTESSPSSAITPSSAPEEAKRQGMSAIALHLEEVLQVEPLQQVDASAEGMENVPTMPEQLESPSLPGCKSPLSEEQLPTEATSPISKPLSSLKKKSIFAPGPSSPPPETSREGRVESRTSFAASVASRRQSNESVLSKGSAEGSAKMNLALDMVSSMSLNGMYRRQATNGRLEEDDENARARRAMIQDGCSSAGFDNVIPLAECDLFSNRTSVTGGEFELLRVWTEVDNKLTRALVKRNSFKRTATALSRLGTGAFEVEETVVEQQGQEDPENSYIFHPHSLQRSCWDVLSLLLTAYEMGYLPMQLFSLQPTTFTGVMTWIARIFWTLDMPISFVTGFVKPNGSVEMRWEVLARRYVTRYLWLDLFLVLLDWADFFFTSVANGAEFMRMGKATRAFRIIRMLRLLRLVRIQELVRLLAERVQSESLTIFLRILQSVFVVVAASHIIGCIWYGIGVANIEETDMNWVTMSEVEGTSLTYRYSLSLHWALAQFAGGMDEVRPYNASERIYAVIIFVIAFMMAAMIISELTASLTQLNILTSHQSRHLAMLRRYLHQNGISSHLSMRVQRNAIFAMEEAQRMMPEQRVELLNLVSEPLRIDIHFEMYSPVLEVHPFFLNYIAVCPQVMSGVCHSAVSSKLISNGDILFTCGEIALSPTMYIVCNGNLSYIHDSAEQTQVDGGSCICEASLWVEWMHRGNLRAESDGRVCLVDAEAFQEIVTKFRHQDLCPTEYAKAYLNHLNLLSSEEINDLGFGSQVQVRLAELGTGVFEERLGVQPRQKNPRGSFIQGSPFTKSSVLTGAKAKKNKRIWDFGMSSTGSS